MSEKLKKEYIERKDLINNRPPQRNPDQTGKEEYNKGYNDGIKAVLSCIEIQPSADVAPVRHGHWNKSKGNEELTEHGFVNPDMYVCSCCGWSCCCRFKIGFKYCPNCGAKMDKE